VLSVEEQILTDFFHGARLRDTAMMAGVSTVDFNPRTDGIVDSFDVVATAPGDPRGDIREVTLDAHVRRLDGGTSRRMMSVTLQRGGSRRWQVTAWRFVSG
jgi:hypothetical protein